MTASSASKTVLIIAGETSGDAHGAHLVRAMRAKDPALEFLGIGGEALRKAGVEILVDAGTLSVVGITEVFAKLPEVLDAISRVKDALRRRRPDLVILIDVPDFNLRIAALAKKRKIPVLYYVSPQIWAWRSGRIRKIRKTVDHVAVILPFEAEYYAQRNVAATFVGHPLLDACSPDAQKPPAVFGEGEGPVIGLLPGSRVSEISRNLPFMLAAASVLRQRFPAIRFLLSIAPAIDREWVASFVAPYRKTCPMELVSGNIGAIFEKSTLIVAASGTVTLETAIYGVPMVIVYRISPISYLLGRALIRVDHIGLVNIIAGKRVVPELIQEAASPKTIAATVAHLLRHPEELQRIREDLALVRKKLGDSGASARTADIALSLMAGTGKSAAGQIVEPKAHGHEI
jgi:lipid-A-disaccharide synthase